MEKPDFVGSWIDDTFCESVDYGNFRMFIKFKEPISDQIDYIFGIIEDYYGKAAFEGELSRKHIEFKKYYFDEDIQQRRAARYGVLYVGEKRNSRYYGEFKVINGIMDNGERGDWTSPFWLEEYSEISEN